MIILIFLIGFTTIACALTFSVGYFISKIGRPTIQLFALIFAVISLSCFINKYSDEFYFIADGIKKTQGMSNE